MKRTLVWLVLGAAVLVTFAGLRLHRSAAAYFERGQAAEAEGDPHQAVRWYGEAMRAYLPLWHPSFTQALRALADMAERSEKEKKFGVALDAWREINASLHAVCSAAYSNPGWLRRSEENIDRLAASAKGETRERQREEESEPPPEEDAP
jgi:hypothetical protein